MLAGSRIGFFRELGSQEQAGLFFNLPFLIPGNFLIPQPRATVVEIIKPHARFTTLSTLKQKGEV